MARIRSHLVFLLSTVLVMAAPSELVRSGVLQSLGQFTRSR